MKTNNTSDEQVRNNHSHCNIRYLVSSLFTGRDCPLVEKYFPTATASHHSHSVGWLVKNELTDGGCRVNTEFRLRYYWWGYPLPYEWFINWISLTFIHIHCWTGAQLVMMSDGPKPKRKWMCCENNLRYRSWCRHDVLTNLEPTKEKHGAKRDGRWNSKILSKGRGSNKFLLNENHCQPVLKPPHHMTPSFEAGRSGILDELNTATLHYIPLPENNVSSLVSFPCLNQGKVSNDGLFHDVVPAVELPHLDNEDTIQRASGAGCSPEATCWPVWQHFQTWRRDASPDLG